MMTKLRGALLLGVIVLSMFAFTGFITPVQAEVGSHKITAVYYKAYIHNDHDGWGAGAGEWYFRLYAAGAWTSYAYCSRDEAGWCDFSDRSRSWSISGGSGTSFQCQAREEDGVWPVTWWDYTSTYTVNIGWPWPSVNMWHDRSYRVGDVTHYFKYYIQNLAPTVGSISGPSSGSPGVAYTFSTSGSDPEGDSMTYQWSVDGVVQPATGPSLTYTFPSAGTYTVRVRTRDYFGAYSGYASKTVTIAMPSITIVRVDVGAPPLYLPGTIISIHAWIKENGSPMTTGTVTARIYAKGVSGKGDVLLDTLVMGLVDPTTGKWQVFSNLIPEPSDPEGFQGTYVVKVTAEHPPATPATKSATCFVADRLLQGTALFRAAESPSRVLINQNFEVKAVIENEHPTQTFTVRLILPSGMTRVSGDPLVKTVTLAPGATTTLRWTLKSTTATNKLVKIEVTPAPGGIVAKLYWYIRDPADTT